MCAPRAGGRYSAYMRSMTAACFVTYSAYMRSMTAACFVTYSAYMRSMTAACFVTTTRRMIFSVGPSSASGPKGVRSAGRMAAFCTRCALLSARAFARLTPAST
eukprot:TRINITY_DN4527_c0_g1_i1.p3 TRINITY_DN4527_c0_g1~~TRINITY_DN4527_c0_g1_i1.p3  ORF type:complete len:104 (+),score=13.93 TRINITY_DN4527_c0_g1_i1:106-417(+)